MTDISILVDYSDVEEAQRHLKDFQGSLNTLNTSRTVSALSRAESEVKKLTQAVQKDRLNNQQYLRGLDEVAKSLFKLGHSQKEAQKIVRQFANEVSTADSRLRRLSGTTQTARASAGVFEAAMQRSTRGMSRNSVMIQQTGYQLGDLLVQYQSGTNILVAFGQQATQVVGTLTTFGGKWVLIGSALGVAIPLMTAVGAALMRTRSEAKDSGVEVESFTDKIKKLTEAYKEFLEVRASENLGISREQLLGRQTAAEAQRELQRAREELSRLENMSRGAPVSGPRGAAVWSETLNTTQEYEAALERVEQAEKALANIEHRDRWEEANRLLEAYEERTKRRKEDEQEFNQNAQEFIRLKQQELDLQRAAFEFGSNSLEVLELTHKQELANLEAKLRSQAAEEGISFQVEETIKAQLESLRLSQEYERSLYGVDDLTRQIMVLTGQTADEAKRASDALKSMMSLDTSSTVASIMNIARALQISTAAAIDLARSMPGYTSGGVSGPDGAVTQMQGLTVPKPISVTTLPNPNAPRTSRGGGGGSGGGAPKETAEDYVKALLKEIESKRELLGLFGDERDIRERVLKMQDELAKKELSVSEQRLIQIAKEQMAVEQALSRQEQLYDTITDNIEDSLMGLVQGTESVADAFRNLISTMILEIYKQQVAQPFAETAGNFISGLVGGFFNAKGNVFSGGAHVKAYAKGGVVNGPTVFPMVGKQVGLMGEAGPEAIMPLKRGSDGKLGVTVNGNQSPTYNVTFNISTPDVQGFNKSKTQIASEMQRMLTQGQRNR